MKYQHTSFRGFTIIELLVVISIIALLVGILLPAISKAIESARHAQSMTNVHNLGVAAATYAAEWNDQQVTFIDANFARYGNNGADAATNYHTQNGRAHPPMLLGTGEGNANGPGTWGYWLPVTTTGSGQNIGSAGNWVIVSPFDFSSKFGSFRIPNGQQFSRYLNGRFYDPIFYAPKDTAVIASVERWFDTSADFVNVSAGQDPYWSSYCFSPAAMFSPDVFKKNTQGKYFTDPFQGGLKSAFRSPTMSQATYPDLKTHILEHHWLQGRKKMCNPHFAGGTFDGCEPYYFNAAADSAPVTLFFDGHVEGCGVRDAMDSCKRVATQRGTANGGLWSIDTPLGGGYGDYDSGGYFGDYAWDYASTSFHILTIDGIKGRDVVSR